MLATTHSALPLPFVPGFRPEVGSRLLLDLTKERDVRSMDTWYYIVYGVVLKDNFVTLRKPCDHTPYGTNTTSRLPYALC